ncbi:MAG: hypothetical protein LBM23_00600 [Propionibacteriaceae bacterium]|nr:hypothetical protein [Propionibacteriaceae bacterium]
MGAIIVAILSIAFGVLALGAVIIGVVILTDSETGMGVGFLISGIVFGVSSWLLYRLTKRLSPTVASFAEAAIEDYGRLP